MLIYQAPACSTDLKFSIVALQVVARFLAGEGATHAGIQLGSCGSLSLCHNTMKVPVPAPVVERDPSGGTPLPPVTPDSEVLLENLFGNPNSVPPPEQVTKQGSHEVVGADGVAVTVSDMLMWCSLDSRNTLYDFILSFDSVVESAVAKTPRTRAEERAEAESEAAGWVFTAVFTAVLCYFVLVSRCFVLFSLVFIAG